MKRIIVFVIFFSILFYPDIFSVKYGSDTAVSIQTAVEFPASDLDNEMLGFGWFKNGFSLEDCTTSCTFSSVFPVSGSIALRGGSLFLNTDLSFSNITTLTAMGKIYGQNHIVTLDSSVGRLINTHYPTTFKDVDLFINSDLEISTTIRIEGDCHINGRSKRMYLDRGSVIEVGHNSTLSLRNLEFEGIRSYNVKCVDDTGKIYLDNVSLYMDEDFNFTTGKLEIWNNVDVAGSYTFFYDCLQTITVAVNSLIRFSDGSTFAVGAKNRLSRDRILYLEDQSSKLWIDNAYVILGSAGGRLTRGSLVLSGRVNFDILSTNTGNGLILGDGTPEGDTIAEFYPASYITFQNGHVVYDESDPNKFISKSSYSKLIRGATNTFHIVKDQIFSNVTITVDSNSALTVEPGTTVGYEDCRIIMPSVKFSITGSRFNTYTTLLDGNDEIFLEDGILPFYLLIQNNNNYISGSGNLSGLVTLYNNNSVLNLNMDGQVLNNVVLNGGTVNLLKRLEFAYDKTFLGSGIINVWDNDLILGSKDLVWTSSIYWDGSGGNIDLNSKVSLSSTWTFSGNCTIRGNANVLDFGDKGNIYVERGSTLKLKNVIVQGLSAQCLQCTDNAGKIIWDNAYGILDGDYTFSLGKLQIDEYADFTGTHTFFYDSTNTITINHNSKFVFSNGITMALGVGRCLNKDRITYFADNTSMVLFNNSDMKVGSNGCRFTRGTLCFTGYVNVDSLSTSTENGIIVGDGSVGNDSLTKFDSASLIRFRSGHLTYNLSDPNKFISLSQYSKLMRDAAHTFYAESDIVFSNVTLKIDPLSPILVAPGKTIGYDNCKFVLPTVKFSINGSRYNSYTSLLSGSDELFLEDGSCPLYLMIQNKGNQIRGSGDLAGQTILYNSDSEINFSLAGQVLNHILLNGGKLNINKDMEVGINAYILGPGIINLNGYDLDLSSKDFVWTSSIYWSGTGGKINLNSRMALTGTWTFSGNCTIVGNNNPIVLKPSGRIYVEKGSVLNFKDVIIYGLAGTNLSCVDNTSKIVFSGVLCKLIDDYYFDKGSFDVSYQMDVKASDKVFHYCSPMQSNVLNCSILQFYISSALDYAPPSPDKNLINLQTRDSVIWLKDASLHATSTGLQLTKGRLIVEGRCRISSDATCKAEAIIFGDGVSAINDLNIRILPSGTFDLTSGYLISKNIVN